MIFRKKILNLVDHHFVSQSEVCRVHFVHIWFCVNNENVFQVDPCMMICNRVILSIPQPSNERLALLWEKVFDLFH